MKLLINGIIYWLNFSPMGFNLLFQNMISILWEYWVWKGIFKQILLLNSLGDKNANRVPTSILQKSNIIISLHEDIKSHNLPRHKVFSKAWPPTMRSKEQKDLSNMTKHLKKYQDKEPIIERMTATAEKAREVKQWKNVRVRLIGKTKASVASRLSRAVASRGFGKQKNTCYLQRTREQWIMSPIKWYTSM